MRYQNHGLPVQMTIAQLPEPTDHLNWLIDENRALMHLVVFLIYDR